MMKYKYVALLVGLICSAFYPTFVSAETRYVSDQLETTLRRGPTLGHAILRMLKRRMDTRESKPVLALKAGC